MHLQRKPVYGTLIVSMPPSTTKEDFARELATIDDPHLKLFGLVADVADQLRELVCFEEKKQENTIFLHISCYWSRLTQTFEF